MESFADVNLIALVAPLILIQFILIVVALIDLLRGRATLAFFIILMSYYL